MFTRLTSLFLAAAVLACPMWCGMGLCHCAPTRTAYATAEQPCPVLGLAPGCCDESSPAKNDSCPDQPTGKSSCQGICGGAVFEQPCQIDDQQRCFVLPLIDAHALFGIGQSRQRLCSFEHCHSLSGDNYGRFLRALHVSFLC